MVAAMHMPTNLCQIAIIVTPHFNAATTLSFVDPFRAANYLSGTPRYRWTIASSDGGLVSSSSGIAIETVPLEAMVENSPSIVVVSSSWTPESHLSTLLRQCLVQWARQGSQIGALDTGAFLLAKAGLLTRQRATVHYEHIDALIEIAPELEVTEDLFTIDGPSFTCCGGGAAVDLALHLVQQISGASLANAVARYLFHHTVRGPSATQNPPEIEPSGHTTPRAVRWAIDLMEANLETPLAIPILCEQLGVSQRQLARLFRRYVHKTPVVYYRDIRLDRARGLVTQTEMPLAQVAVAAGFNSQVHFSRAYRDRFGLPPQKDRIEGRVPFEFRAWPMHSPKG